MLNHIVLMGRLTRDPELRYTQSQIPVASMRIAVDRDFGRGEDRQTDFIDIVAWRQTAEFVSKYFHKGSMMVVSGRLQMRDWTDKDGNKRTSAEVVADNVYFGESARRDGDSRDNYGGRDNSYGGNNSYSGRDNGYNNSRDNGYNNSRDNGYGGGNSNYGGGYGGNSGYSSRNSSRGNDAPSGGSAFSELDDGDGELPF
ncbi:MAG TPA: single-stranded DNA-binding protein [Candidatus Scatomorpha gallistercoris]|nr:single-stranded DNA-binding protein [Candidatus Scatomorpha gallistercoris]